MVKWKADKNAKCMSRFHAIVGTVNLHRVNILQISSKLDWDEFFPVMPAMSTFLLLLFIIVEKTLQSK